MSSSVETQKHTSLAEKLAASARQSQQSAVNQAGNAQGKALGSRTLQSSGSANIPARLEEALDVEGDIPINEVEVGGTPLLKILKHSTDPSSSNASSNPNPVDAVGLLLGLDLSGVAEIVDSYPLPGGVQGALNAVGTGAESDKTPYAQSLLRHLREVALLDSPIGIYLTLHSPTLFSTLISETFNPSSTISGKQQDSGSQNAAGLAPGSGFLVKGIIELMTAVERMSGNRGASGKGGSRAVLVVHDAARSPSGDVSLKAYKFSDGFAAALRKQKFDTQTLIEHRLAPSNILQPLKLRTKNPALLNALFAEMSTPAEGTSLRESTNKVLPSTFLPLQNTTATSLPLSLSNTLSQLTNLSMEQNNLAYQLRQVGREKSRHEQAVQARQQENELRKKQGLAPLPDVAEPPARKVQDPSRLDLMLCLGAVDNAAKGLGAEAGKGLVKAFASG